VLVELKARLKDFNERISLLEKKLYDKDSKLDMEVYEKIQFYRNEVHYTKKKIKFVNQGKRFLGDAFPSYNTGGL
tara:strand:- start:1724 stop:1948 length:225 start_codon:yes stop_codon:yes gene_type:complete